MKAMKKAFFALATLFLTIGIAQAQEDGAKLAKSAGKALASYNLDPGGNAAKLEEAKTKINQALQTPEVQGLASAWITKGDIYNSQLQAIESEKAKAQITGKAIADIKGCDECPIEAFGAYSKALAIPTIKKGEKADALKGITDIQAGLINGSLASYEAKDYKSASFRAKSAMESHKLLTGAGQKSLIEESKVNDQLYFIGLCALLDKNYPDAINYLEQLYAKGNAGGEVYEALYQANTESGNADGAKKYLLEGRTKYPDNTGLLFAEINQYLKEGKLDELTDRLKEAIAREPNNVSLYINLGRVYDDLQQRETKAKNAAKADAYFEEAKKYYMQAAEKDVKSPDAHYMLGALYYNKAALINQDMAALDNSSASLKKYKELNDKMLAMFDTALPYFQKSESLDANDINTLIALNEIYARKEDELSLEFKKRLEVVKGGGKNAASHFKL
jgi:hypothetical protein